MLLHTTANWRTKFVTAGSATVLSRLGWPRRCPPPTPSVGRQYQGPRHPSSTSSSLSEKEIAASIIYSQPTCPSAGRRAYAISCPRGSSTPTGRGAELLGGASVPDYLRTQWREILQQRGSEQQDALWHAASARCRRVGAVSLCRHTEHSGRRSGIAATRIKFLLGTGVSGACLYRRPRYAHYNVNGLPPGPSS